MNGLNLNVYTMDRYMFLWKGIEFQLKEYGVKLNYTITKSEKALYEQYCRYMQFLILRLTNFCMPRPRRHLFTIF